MSNKFTPDPDNNLLPAKKTSQQLLLLLLLLLAAIFAYLYFFTGLIKTRDSEPKPEPPSQAAVKKPLPPRPDQGAAALAAKVAEPATPASPEAKPVTAAAPAPQAKGAPPALRPKVVRPAATVASAPQVPAATPAAPPKEAQPAAAAERKPAARPAAPAEEAKPEAAAERKPATKPAVPANEAKPAAKETAVVSAAAKPAAGAKKTAAAAPKKHKFAAKPAAAYVLDINGDFAESELGPLTTKLKQAGVGRVVKTRAQKSEPMHRLFLADFANRDEALDELQRLKSSAPSAFVLKENSRYTVYAGSFMRQEKVSAEQRRLLAKGVKLLVRDATASVAVTRVRAGSFADRASADKAVKTLNTAGLSAKVVKVGK